MLAILHVTLPDQPDTQTQSAGSGSLLTEVTALIAVPRS